jgi:Ti-type conjugative transfer relaxase TraA
VLAVVEASPELVRLGVDGRGRERFTTREMLACERRMEQAAAELAGGEAHRVGLAARWWALRTAERDGLALEDEQRDALGHVTSGRDLAVVVGYAGTGKSAMLGVARVAWETEGYRVRGAALSGIAAEGLEAGSGIESRTLASLEWGWKEGRDQLGPKDILVVDEAGMVGSRQMERVLTAAQQAGAKVVLVGDPEQLQAIEAGAAFRAIAERVGWAEIGEVRRQRAEWQREATRELATGQTEVALSRYERAGLVVGHGTREEARAGLVEAWDAERQAAPGQSRVILAYTRADVAELNALARERLRAAGELGVEQRVATERGERAFAAGDRVMFLKNERGLGVKNGTLGTVEGIEAGGRLAVRLDGVGADGSARRVSFELRDYGHVDHGYAATIHKAQGVTVERAHVLASAHMDRHAAYVALTRHRDGVVLHYVYRRAMMNGLTRNRDGFPTHISRG